MSLGKDIQRAEAKIRALEARITEDDVAKTALSQENEALKASAEKAGKAVAEAVTAARADFDKAKVELEGQITAATTQSDAMKAELEKAQEELKQAKILMANPAFADAKAQGQADAAPATPEPLEADAPSLYDQYQAIADPVARTKFWNENEKALREEARATFNK